MSTNTTQAINFAARLALSDDRRQPRVITRMNDYQFKLVKIEGDFVWHSHVDANETFIILAGRLRVGFRSDAVHLSPGGICVVPRDVEHEPLTEDEVRMLLVEPCGMRNTDDQGSGRTAVSDLWV